MPEMSSQLAGSFEGLISDCNLWNLCVRRTKRKNFLLIRRYRPCSRNSFVSAVLMAQCEVSFSSRLNRQPGKRLRKNKKKVCVNRQVAGHSTGKEPRAAFVCIFVRWHFWMDSFDVQNEVVVTPCYVRCVQTDCKRFMRHLPQARHFSTRVTLGTSLLAFSYSVLQSPLTGYVKFVIIQTAPFFLFTFQTVRRYQLDFKFNCTFTFPFQMIKSNCTIKSCKITLK